MKLCNKCGERKPFNLFYTNKTKSDGLQSNCKACCNLRSKEHYERNVSYYVDKAKKNTKTAQSRTIELKAFPCVDCGKSYPHYVMEFDHLNPQDKIANISELRKASWERLLSEIAKCELVCANCHRERTFGSRPC